MRLNIYSNTNNFFKREVTKYQQHIQREVEDQNLTYQEIDLNTFL